MISSFPVVQNSHSPRGSSTSTGGGVAVAAAIVSSGRTVTSNFTTTSKLMSSVSSSNIRVRMTSMTSTSSSEKTPSMNCTDIAECLRTFCDRESSLIEIKKVLPSLNRNTLIDRFNAFSREERIRVECEEKIIRKYFSVRADEQSLRELVVHKLLNGILSSLQASYESNLKANKLDEAHSLLFSTSTFKDDVQKIVFANPFRFTQALRTIVTFSRQRFAEFIDKLSELVINERNKLVREEEILKGEQLILSRRTSRMIEDLPLKERGHTATIMVQKGISADSRSLEVRTSLKTTENINEDTTKSKIKFIDQLLRTSIKKENIYQTVDFSLNQSDRSDIGASTSLASTLVLLKKPRVYSAVGDCLTLIQSYRKSMIHQQPSLRLSSPPSHNSSQARIQATKPTEQQKPTDKIEPLIGLKQLFVKPVEKKNKQVNLFGQGFQSFVRLSRRDDQIINEKSFEMTPEPATAVTSMLNSQNNKPLKRVRVSSFEKAIDQSGIQSDSLRVEQDARRSARTRRRLGIFPPRPMQWTGTNRQTVSDIEETFAYNNSQSEVMPTTNDGTDQAKEIQVAAERLFTQLVRANIKVKQTITQFVVESKSYLLKAAATFEARRDSHLKSINDSNILASLSDEQSQVIQQKLTATYLFKQTSNIRPRTGLVRKTLAMDRLFKSDVQINASLSQSQSVGVLPLNNCETALNIKKPGFIRPQILVMSPTNKMIETGFPNTPKRYQQQKQNSFYNPTHVTPEDYLRVKQVVNKQQKDALRAQTIIKQTQNNDTRYQEEGFQVITEVKAITGFTKIENVLDQPKSNVVVVSKLLRPSTEYGHRTFKNVVDQIQSLNAIDEQPYTVNSMRKSQEVIKTVEKRTVSSKRDEGDSLEGRYKQQQQQQQFYEVHSQYLALQPRLIGCETPGQQLKKKSAIQSTSNTASPLIRKMHRSVQVRPFSKGLAIKIEKLLTENNVIKEVEGITSTARPQQAKEQVALNGYRKQSHLERFEEPFILVSGDDLYLKGTKRKKVKDQRPATSEGVIQRRDSKRNVKAKLGI